MRKILVLASVLVIVCLCMVYTPPPVKSTPVNSITFSITSSAATATPNLRIQPQSKKLASASGVWIQGFAPDVAPLNYYLTKNQVVTTTGYSVINVQAAQDTKMKINGASTYYMLYADTDYTFVIHE